MYLAEVKQSKGDILMGWLAVTFHGPFAFQIEARSVDVFAPKCDNHHAAVFSVNDEYPLCGRHKIGGEYTYILEGTGITNNSGPIDYVDVKNWILAHIIRES
jgi:hypothetical protein